MRLVKVCAEKLKLFLRDNQKLQSELFDKVILSR